MNTKPVTSCSVVVVLALVLAVLPTVEPPAWAQAPAGDPVERVGGSSRVETAVALSARFFDRADTVVLATAGRYPDALAAGPLARAERAPILLTPPAALPATVAAEIDRLGADRVIVVGEESAVGPDVVSTLSDAGLDVERLGGPERFATAAAVAARLQAGEDVTVHTVARGRGETEDDGFADALTAGTLGVLGEVRPTVLTERDLLPDPSAAALADQASALVIGGVAAVSAPVASEVDRLVGATTRIAGPNRAATSIAIADQVIGVVGPPREVLVVTGSTFPDSLVAGALTAQLQAPILLVPSNLRDGFRGGEEQPIRFETAAPEVTDFLREWCEEIERATVVGLDAAVSPAVEEAVARLINCAPLEGEFTPGEDPPTEPTEPTEEPTTDLAEDPDPTPGGGGVVTPPPPPPGGVVVPDVVGLLQGEGMQRITASSLVPTSGGSRHDASPAGTILEQEPPGGVTVARQTPVEIVVSLGPELGIIPDVRGQTESQARDTITGAGFTLGQVGEDAFDEDGIDPGEVGRQLPLAGQRALPGTPVDVDLSVGGVNHPPTITSTPTPTHVTGGAPWAYDAAATDPDGDTLTFVLQGGPLDDDGDLAASIDPSTGVVTWDAQAEDAGPTDFAVRAEDGRGGQDVQSFTVDVAVPNRPPEPAEDVYTAVIDAVLTVPTDTGVLANDIDPDEDPLSASLLDPPANGTVDLAADGSFTYTPTPVTGGGGTFTDIDLTQLSGVTVTATAENGSYPASRLVDGYPGSSWYVPSSAGSAGHAITLEFPQPVTPDTLTLLGNRDRFADDGYGVTEVDVQLLDGAGAVLLDLPGQAFDPQVPGDGQDPDLTIDLAAAAGGAPPTGVRTMTIAITATDGRYPGLGEVVLEGDGPILDLGPVMEWDRSGTGNAFRVEATPTTADLDGDGHPEVVFPTFDATLHVVDGRTGQERWTATGVQGQSASAVIADLHASPGMEVAIQRTGDSSVIAVFSAEGDLLDEVDGPDNLGEANMAVADVDGDGVAELVLPAGNRITTAAFDGDDLALEWTSPARGCGNNAYRSNCIPIVADIDLDGIAEVVAGTTIYDGRDGSVEAEGTTPADGWAATGQFDADPEAELVVVAGGQVHLLNHDLTPVWATPTAIPEGGSGGAPTVADFDGDGRPEVGVAGARRYVVLDGDGSVLWALPTDDTSSNRTGSTVFDFDDDGVAEVVYRDENRLFVLAGPDGSIRFQTPMGSTTTVEAPIVADVDADGHAEIVVVSDAAQGLPDGTSRQPGVYVFGGPADNWVRARTIWNQHSYHVTNVGVDGVVPQVEPANWLDPALNNYRQNEFPAGDRSGLDSFTYTVSDGADSAVGTAHVDLRPEENAPAFTCDPAPVAVVGLPYTSRLCATDPDPGDSLTFTGDASVDVVVPGTANPWLAGYPDGSTHAGGDRVPENAPVEVPLPLVPGRALTFAATGGTSYTASCCSSGPDGSSGGGHGAQNGYGGLTTNWNALIGVFTGPEVPADPATPPDSLDFSTEASRNQPVIAPDVEQVFFIGDGLTADGVVQQIVVPEGAMGLYLGSMDGFGWYNNSGQFEVTISSGEQGGPSVAPGTGLLTWTPGPEDVGEWIYLYAVTDATGRVTYGLFPIQVVFPATVPSVVGLPQVEASRALSDAGLRTGTITEVHDLDVPAGAVVAQQVPGDTVIAPDTRIDLVVSLGPAPGDEDLDVDGSSPNEGDCDDTDPDIHPGADDVVGDGVDHDCDGRDGIPAIDHLEVRPATATARVGERRSLVAVVVYTDGSSQDVTLLSGWDSSAPGVAAVRGPGVVDAIAAGDATIGASYQGVQADATLTVRAPAPVDTTPPTLAISQPAGGSTVSTATDVIGTASDANMASWTLDLLDAGGRVVARLGQGTTSVVDGVLGAVDPAGRADGVYTLRLVAEDLAGNRLRGELLIRIGAPPGGATIEALLLNPANPQVVQGDTLPLVATAYYSDGSTVDVGGAGTWGTADAGVATVDAAGVLTGTGQGSTTVRVTFDGMDASRPVVVYPDSWAGSDRTAPTAALTDPAAWATVTEPVAVVGTATDADLLRWTLDLVDGTDVVATVATGEDGVAGDVLGTLDPTLLHNGSYQLRLVVEDVTGNTSTATAPVVIDGALKVGTFDLSFVDLVVPAAGLPITVTRRYDTRTDTVGDFGAGWDLELSRLPVSHDGVAGEGWTLSGGGFAFRLQPTQTHTTTITLPDGSAEVFSFSPTPSASAFIPPTFVTAGYTPLPGTRGRLEVIGNRNLLVLGGVNAPTELVDDTTFEVFRPAGLRYTAADGTRWDLRRDGTVTAITSPDGATITIGPDGIIHSGGASATFERDATGRITAITDPAGNRQAYAYDAAGDLVAHTDPDGVVTRFRYTGDHDLVEITDPLGRPLARTEYDDQGRVVAITDAAGNRTAFEHDLGVRQDVVVEADGSRTIIGYDERGNVTSRTDARGGVTTHTYDDADNQLTTTDSLGRTTTRTFDDRGNVLTTSDPAGATTTFTYGPGDRVTSVTGPDGERSTWTYDSRGNLIAESGPATAEATHSYDAFGNLRTTTDATGATTTHTYDADGNRTATTDARGATTRTTYDPAGEVATITDPLGVVTRATSTPRGDLATVTAPGGGVTEVTTNAAGTITEVTGPDGTTTSRVVDGLGRDVATTDAAGRTTTYGYDAVGNLTSITPPDGAATTLGYDALGNRTSRTTPDGVTTTWTYDAAGQPTAMTTADGTTTTSYDVAGNPVAETGPTGERVEQTWTAAGRLATITDPAGGVTTLTTDARGRVTGRTAPDGTTVQREYDDADRLVAEVDQLGNRTTYAYDAVGNLVEVVDAGGGTTRATYDLDGNLTSLTDAEGAVVRYRYDDLGRRVAEIAPDGGTTTHTYDAAGDLVATTDPAGRTTTTTHDDAGQPVEVTHPDGSTTTMTWTADGLLASATDAAGTVTYTYDTDRRLASMTQPDGAGITWTYDDVGRVATMTADTGAATRRTSYGYDAAGRLASVTADGRTTTYDHADGRLVRITRPGGIVTDLAHDPVGRLVGIDHATPTDALGIDITRDLRGDATTVTRDDGVVQTFTYDLMRRISAESHDVAGTVTSHTFTHDLVGNRLTDTDGTGAVTTATYDDAHRLLQAGDRTFTADALGRQTSVAGAGGTQLLGWDARGRLASVTMPDGTTVTHTHDPSGTRTGSDGIARLVDPLSPTGFAEVVAEYDPADGAPLAWFTWGVGLVEQDLGGVIAHPLLGHEGSVVALADAGGAITATARDAFGALLPGATPLGTPYGLHGQRLEESGLYHMRARDYRPETGRFTSVEPLDPEVDDPSTLHPYTYALGNPQAFLDPSGERGLTAEIAIAAAINGIVSAAVAAAFELWQKGTVTVANVLTAGIIGAIFGGGGAALSNSVTSAAASSIAANQTRTFLVKTITTFPRLTLGFVRAIAGTGAVIAGDVIAQLRDPGGDHLKRWYAYAAIFLSFWALEVGFAGGLHQAYLNELKTLMTAAGRSTRNLSGDLLETVATNTLGEQVTFRAWQAALNNLDNSALKLTIGGRNLVKAVLTFVKKNAQGFLNAFIQATEGSAAAS